MNGGIHMTKKMDHPNPGVKCSVNTCTYYLNGDYCSADQIQVMPKNAHSAQETDCMTFQAKSH